MENKDHLMSKKFKSFFLNLAIEKPKTVLSIMLVSTLTMLILAVVPSLFPKHFPNLNGLKIDTDPENMLPHDEPARVFHDEMKKNLDLSELVAVGVVNKNGIYNKKSLNNIYTLANYAKTLDGVIAVDILAPSTVDNVESGSLGEVKFEWLFAKPLENEEQALAIKNKVKRLPFLQGTIFSEDDQAIAILVPITSKDKSYRIYNKLNEKIKTLEGDDTYHIAGLPVAEDVFGVEMFKQMAISAPIAMVIIFLLMLFFFKSIKLVLSPMIVAMVSVITTMGLLVATGNTVHIMSSMIPIFIMPIAVLDAVHILSDFFDVYPKMKDRKKALYHVMDALFEPMLFTSLTTFAGFFSLALTPIPPVQIFGVFVAIGVLLAWFWTILYIPSFIVMGFNEEALKNFGNKPLTGGSQGFLDKILLAVSVITHKRAKLILLTCLVILIFSGIGISKIVINDNPTRWFEAKHPIRVADKVMNTHLAGTYTGYLALSPTADGSKIKGDFINYLKPKMTQYMDAYEDPVSDQEKDFILNTMDDLLKSASNKTEFYQSLESSIEEKIDSGSNEDFWEYTLELIDKLKSDLHIFKNPEVLSYMDDLQNHLTTLDVVGKSSSLVDVVKTVNRELLGGADKEFRIPDKKEAIAQSLITYQSSHRPQDLWRFVTPDFQIGNIWVQMKSGNNQDMQAVVSQAENFINKRPLPSGLSHRWFGLTYINLVWQQQMVSGMLSAFLGSFVIVLLMMTFLFRSLIWGILSMIPLSVTIILIYGLVGWAGKDYDMPVAVLSSLSLGLAIDYAIHFLARSREIRKHHSNWSDALGVIFSEPARAISRNIVVIGLGFLPLLLAPLVPYQTVGILIASILLSAGIVTLVLLPTLMTLLNKQLFKNN